VARVRAILKRSAGQPAPPVLVHGGLTLDPAARICRAEGVEVALTATEFQLLACLVAEPDRLVARGALVGAIWGRRSAVSDRTLDSHLRNLRQKLADAGLSGVIESLHGQGFRLGPRG